MNASKSGHALLAACLVVLTACGSETDARTVNREPSVAADTAIVGNAIAQDCGRFGLGAMLRQMRQTGYMLAVVKVERFHPPQLIGANPGTVYTPIDVSYSDVLSGASPQPNPLYIAGGTTAQLETHATGPNGVAPGEVAFVMVPPKEFLDGAPEGWVEAALPVQAGEAFASDQCWKPDMPQASRSSQSVVRAIDGKPQTGPTEPGFRVPVAALKAQVSPGG